MSYPEGWNIAPLRTCIRELRAGVSVNSADRPVRSGEVGVLKTSSVTGGIFDPRENKAVIPEDVSRVKTSVVGDRIIMSRMNTPTLVGANAYVKETDPNLYLPDRLWRLEPNSDAISMHWLSFVLGSKQFRQRLCDMATGTSNSMKNISKEDVLNLEVLCPPLPEQRRIAELLGTWDEAIEKLERLIAAKERQFSFLIEELLYKREKLWSSAALGRFFTERIEVGCPNLELLAITSSLGIVRRSEVDKVDSSSEDKSKYRRIYPGDIGYNTMRMWQGVCGASRYSGIVSPAYTVLIPSPQTDATFSEFYFKSPHVISILKRHSQGLVDDTLNLKYQNFSKIKLPWPSLDEQKRIVTLLSTAKEELAILSNQQVALQKQKRGLMQKLLTGNWRV